MLKIKSSSSADFLAGGGEMGALTRAHGWAAGPLGLPETWPQSLRTAVRLLLNTNHPMLLWWGPHLIQFYNDAYRETAGAEFHPAGMAGTRSGTSSVPKSSTSWAAARERSTKISFCRSPIRGGCGNIFGPTA